MQEVNIKVDKGDGLMPVPGFDAHNEIFWKIRLLKVEGRSLAFDALSKWLKHSRQDFKSILKVMAVVGTTKLPPGLPYTKKSQNYEVYEMIGANVRLMFFYEKQMNVAICTNAYEKNSSSEQGTAFGKCENARIDYAKWPPSQKKL